MPVAQTHIGCEQSRHWYQGQYGPVVSDAESALGEPHQQQPPTTEEQHAQPGIIKELGEETTDIRQETSWHQHRIAEIKRGVKKQVVLLNLPKKISLEAEQSYSNEQQSSQPRQEK